MFPLPGSFWKWMGVLVLMAWTSQEVHAQAYKLWWVRCSDKSRVWRRLGMDEKTYGANPNNYSSMKALADRLNRQEASSGSSQRYAVGTPSKPPSGNPCGSGSTPTNGGTGGTGGNGGNNGGNTNSCGSLWDVPYYSVIYTDRYGTQRVLAHFCCRGTANYYRNLYASHYTSFSWSVVSRSYRTYSNRQCSPYTIRCSNGIVQQVPNNGINYTWRCQ